MHTTAQQHLVVLDVPADRAEALADALELEDLRVRPSAFRRGTMACTGLEFCKLAIVETKARASQITAELERRLPSFDEPLRINVNGCPNSCARYQLADIGFMGVLVNERSDGNGGVSKLEGFNVHVGGHLGSQRRFGRKVRGVRLRADELASFAENLIRIYLSERSGQRSFGEWITSHEDPAIDRIAKRAAQGLERVGPVPVASDEIRPEDD